MNTLEIKQAIARRQVLRGAIVDFARDDFLGIMMPMRTGAEGLTYNPSQFKKAV